MANRTVNVVISFLEPDAAPVPMSTIYNVSSHGYKSPDSPYYFAPPRLKSNVTFEKSIGTVFWGEQSSVDFGNIDISIEDDGADEIAGTEVRWVEWAKSNLNPQVVISLVQSDGTLLHIATADTEDVYFPDDRTIRVKLIAKHQRRLERFINDYLPDTVDEDVRSLPVPIYLGGGSSTGGSPYDPATVEPQNHVPALLVDEANLRYVATSLDILSTVPSSAFVMDRGVTLREGATPGFTLVDNGFELTNNPDGNITFTWFAPEDGGVDDPLDTGNVLGGPFRICRWAVSRAGIDTATHFPAEVDFPNLYPAGFSFTQVPQVYYGSEVSARQLLNDVILNLSGWWYVDELGNFQFGKLVNPDGETPVQAYTDVEMVGGISARVDRAPGLSNLMKFAWNPGFYDIGNLAGSVTLGRKRKLSQEWQQVKTAATIPATYEPNQGNKPMTLYTGGQFRAGAQTEVDRRWTDYYSGIRRFYRFTIPLRGGVTLPELGDVVTIQSERAELLEYGALPVLVRRMKFDLGAGLIDIEGWGGETAAAPPPFDPRLADIKTDLVSWWTLEEAVGTRVDSHGTNDFTAVNAPANRPAVKGDGLDSDNTSKYLIQAAGTGTDFANNGDFTIALWVNIDAFGASTINAFFSKTDYSSSSTSNDDIRILAYSPASLNWFDLVLWDETNNIGTTPGPAPVIGENAFLVATYNATTRAIQFIVNNGAPANNTLGAARRVSADADLVMGIYKAANPNFHNGFIDETAYWSRVLTADEIAGLYNDGHGVTYSELP